MSESRACKLACQFSLLAGAWILIGMAVGLLSRESVGPGALHAVSNMIAGAILLPLLGLPTYFLGARGGEALLGGSLGGICGGLASFIEISAGEVSLAPVGVIMGALFAVTAGPFARVWIRMARCWIGKSRIARFL